MAQHSALQHSKQVLCPRDFIHDNNAQVFIHNTRWEIELSQFIKGAGCVLVATVAQR